MAQFFLNNMEYVFLSYGFAFIFMGVSILVQPMISGLRRLTKNIWLLAVFALLHGINEWLDMASVIYPDQKIIKTLSFVFLIASFCFLFEFGRGAVKTSAALKGKLSSALPWWLMPTLSAICLIVISTTSGQWLLTGQILSRYLIAFPGALLTAYGIMLHRADYEKFKNNLLISGLGFAFYAVFAGLIVPKGGIFPSNIINTENFLSVVHIPVQVFRAIIAYSITGIFIRLIDGLTMEDIIQENVPTHGAQNVNRGYMNPYIMAALMSVATIILLVVTVSWTKDREVRNVYQVALEHLKIYNGYLLNKVHNFNASPKFIAENPLTIEAVKQPDKRNHMNDILYKYKESISASSVFILDKDGIVIMTTRDDSTPVAGKNLSFRDYFQKAIKGIPYENVSFGAVTKMPGYYTAYPIRDSDTIIGAAVVKYDFKLFAPHKQNDKELFVVEDKNGVILYSSDARYNYHIMDNLTENVIQSLRESRQYADEPLLPLPIVKTWDKDGLSFITIAHHKQSDSQHEYTDIDYLNEELHYEGIGWHIHLLSDISDIKFAVIKNALYILFLMITIYIIIIFSSYKAKTKNMLITSYSDLLRQKEISDNYTKVQTIINTALYISLSSDSFDVKLQMILQTIFVLAQSMSSKQMKGCIFICDNKMEMLHLTASYNFSKDQISACSKIPYGKCLCGMAASTKNIVFTSSCNGGLHTGQFEQPSAHGHYCVPIRSSTELLGVLNIVTNSGYERNDEDKQFLSSIANILAGVILRNKEMQLIEMDRAASVTTLAAGIAHEINNPLSFIKSAMTTFKKNLQVTEHFVRHSQTLLAPEYLSADYIKMLQEFEMLDAISKMNKKLETSSRGIERITEVVNGLRQFAQLNKAEITDVNINKCIDETLSIMITEQTKVKIVKVCSELPMYPCEPQAINQCFYHILDNAMQAVNAAAAGNITITTLHIRQEDKGQTIEIRIADDGIGMSEEAVKHAFVPFYTTKEVGSGKGLGLSIVDGIIKRHNGEVKIESTQGKGTTVTIHLPLKKK